MNCTREYYVCMLIVQTLAAAAAASASDQSKSNSISRRTEFARASGGLLSCLVWPSKLICGAAIGGQVV